MDLENMKLLFRSKTIVDNLYQHVKLYKVFNNIWVKMYKNNKGIYVCLNKKELFGAFGDVWSKALKMCSNCQMRTVFFANVSKISSMSLKKETYISKNFQIICGEFI